MIIFIHQLIHTSCMMAVIAVLYILAGVFTNGKYFAGDFYLAGKMILFGFLIPFRPRITAAIPVGLTSILHPESAGPLRRIFTVPVENFKADGTVLSPVAAASLVKMVFLLWCLGFAAVLLYHIMKYLYFKKTAGRWSEDIVEDEILEIFRETKDQLGITSHLQIKKCACISGPMLIQLLQPVILLPDNQMTGEDLKLVLRHEMIHLKRKDLWYRWTLLLAAAINWFNPVIYVFHKAFTCYCELSCDELVTENMPESGKYRYSMILLRLAGDRRESNTLFSSFCYGGKRYMKKRIFTIMNAAKKRWGAAVFTVCFLSIFCAGTVFAAPADKAGARNDSAELQISTNIFRTTEDIDREMEESFSEVFSNEFKAENFPGMIITYDEKGIPIVADPDDPKKKAVYAMGKYEKNGVYSSSDCSDSGLIFYILKGKQVEVLDSSYKTAAAKVTYAGAAGYMKKSELKF